VLPPHRARRALAAALTVLLPHAAARAQAAPGEPFPSRCGAGIPADEARGYVPLPRGDVFCPLVADPKGVRSFVTYLRGDAAEFAENVGSVGIADAFGLFRFGGRAAGDGVQLSLAGGVFAQFDLGTRSYDLLNADYLIGLPLTVRRGGFSTRLRVYHQSSHLGDEFLLRDEAPERENLSFESAELLLSQDVGPVRVYGGGEYFFHRTPAGLPEALGHAGLELRPPGSVRVGTVGRVRLLGAVDVKAVREDGWEHALSVRAGLEVSRAREAAATPSRRWSLLYEFYDGRSPYGQFHQQDVRFAGVGFHFTL
jgi:hypothetical protein